MKRLALLLCVLLVVGCGKRDPNAPITFSTGISAAQAAMQVGRVPDEVQVGSGTCTLVWAKGPKLYFTLDAGLTEFGGLTGYYLRLAFATHLMGAELNPKVRLR